MRPDQLLNPTPARQRGAAAVEFAIVLSVLMLVLAGTVEIGRALWYYDALAKGTRDAARYLSTVAAGNLNGQLAQARNIVVAAGTSARVPAMSAALVTAGCDAPAPLNCATVPAGGIGTVTVSVGYPMVIGEWIPFVPVGDRTDSTFAVTLRPRTTMRHMW